MSDAAGFTDSPDGVLIEIWAKPRASKSKIDGLHDGALAVRLAAPPVEGAANSELIKFLSKKLKIPKGDLELVRGEASRHKRVLARGVSGAEAARLLKING